MTTVNGVCKKNGIGKREHQMEDVEFNKKMIKVCKKCGATYFKDSETNKVMLI